MKNILLIILAVICIATYLLMLNQHDMASERAISTETIYTFNGEENLWQ